MYDSHYFCLVTVHGMRMTLIYEAVYHAGFANIISFSLQEIGRRLDFLRIKGINLSQENSK